MKYKCIIFITGEDTAKHEDDDDEDDFAAGITGLQKAVLGFIWFASGVYSILSEQVLSKERVVPCTLRQELSQNMNLISLLLAIGIPLLIGPILCPLAHLILSFCSVCCAPLLKAKGCNNKEVHRGTAPLPTCSTICRKRRRTSPSC